MEAQRKIQPLVCGNPCWSGSVALEEVLSEARQRQRRDPHAMCTKTLKVTRQHKFTNHTLAYTLTQRKRWNTKRHILIVITGKSCAVKKGSSFLKMFQICHIVEGEFNLLCPLGCCSSYEFSCILKWGYPRQESTLSETWQWDRGRTQTPTETKGLKEVFSIKPTANCSRRLGQL